MKPLLLEDGNMIQLEYGTLIFNNEKEYYTALGIFCNPRLFRIHFEPNKLTGSYGNAYRLRKLKDVGYLIKPIENAIKSQGRINSNSYVENLLQNHNFISVGSAIYGKIDDVIHTVPKKYKDDFIHGYFKYDNYLPKQSEVTAKLKKVGLPKRIKTTSESNVKKTVRKTYGQQRVKTEIDKLIVGKKGEELVFGFEKEKLIDAYKAGEIDSIAKHIEWVSEKDDNAGYDIKSFDVKQNKTIFIEVKTTTKGKNTPFFISKNEIEYIKKDPENCYIYRVFNLYKNPSFYVIKGTLLESDIFKVEACNYIVSVNG